MKPTTHTNRNAFSMIEIVLALMVVAIGIIGIIGLFPVGMRSNQAAVGQSNASRGADQFLHHMASKIRVNKNVLAAFPDTKPIANDGNGSNEFPWGANLLSDSHVSLQALATNAGDEFDPAENNSGIFRLRQITPGNLVDFTGIIRSWKEEITYTDERLCGDIMPWGVPDLSNGSDAYGFGYQHGETYTLKYCSGSSAGWGHGNFGALAMGGTGANVYRNNIINGYQGSVVSGVTVSAETGDTYAAEPGNMAGPTNQGLAARLPDHPYVRVPVVTAFGHGRCQVTVLGFLSFKLVGTPGTGNSASQVRAIYLGPDWQNTASSRSQDATRVTLHVEISWPAQVPYIQRNKQTYSLDVFRPGAMTSFVTH